MNISRKAVSRLYRTLKGYGFKRKGNDLYRIIDDVVIVVVLETVFKQTRISFTIIPLFLPGTRYIYLTYGNRLNYLFTDIGYLNFDADEDTINRWCNCVIEHLISDVFPVLNRITTAESLYAFSAKMLQIRKRESVNVWRDYFICGIDHFLKLYLYSSIYIGEREEALKAARQYIGFLTAEEPYTVQVQEKRIAQTEKTITLIEQNRTAEIEELFSAARKAVLDGFS